MTEFYVAICPFAASEDGVNMAEDKQGRRAVGEMLPVHAPVPTPTIAIAAMHGHNYNGTSLDRPVWRLRQITRRLALHGLRRGGGGGGYMARETKPGGVRPRHEEQFPIQATCI